MSRVPDPVSTNATLVPSSERAGDVATTPPAAVMLYDQNVVAATPVSLPDGVRLQMPVVGVVPL